MCLFNNIHEKKSFWNLDQYLIKLIFTPSRACDLTKYSFEKSINKLKEFIKTYIFISYKISHFKIITEELLSFHYNMCTCSFV